MRSAASPPRLLGGADPGGGAGAAGVSGAGGTDGSPGRAGTSALRTPPPFESPFSRIVCLGLGATPTPQPNLGAVAAFRVGGAPGRGCSLRRSAPSEAPNPCPGSPGRRRRGGLTPPLRRAVVVWSPRREQVLRALGSGSRGPTRTVNTSGRARRLGPLRVFSGARPG